MRRTFGRLGILLSAVLLLLTFSAPSCTQSTSVDADEVVAEALAAQAGLVSYQMDFRMVEHIVGDVDGSALVCDGWLDISAAVDQTNKRAQMSLTMRFEYGGYSEANFTMSAEEYLVGNRLYMGISTTDDDELEWTKKDLAAGFWEESEMMQQQLDLLESAGRKLVKSEKVNGVDCYVFDLAPSSVAEALRVFSQESLMREDFQFTTWQEDWVRGLSVRQWIAKDGAHLMKSETEMTLHMEASDIDPSLGDGEFDATATVEVFYHDYNEPVSIELPPEALALR